jgi:hypothetical protein
MARLLLAQPIGNLLVPSDDRPTFYDPFVGQVFPIPNVVLVAGTSYVSGIVHLHQHRGLLRFCIERGKDLRLWPQESGGIQQLEKIERRIIELGENFRPFRNRQAAEEFAELLRPERERQQQRMVNACQRVVHLVYHAAGFG